VFAQPGSIPEHLQTKEYLMAKLDLVGIVVKDMAESLAFYRQLGLDIPSEADTQPHVEVTLPGGMRVAWDTRELMASIYEQWPEPHGHRTALAFLCETPQEVDSLYHQLIASGYQGHKAPGMPSGVSAMRWSWIQMAT
jgi:hypothetical protein